MTKYVIIVAGGNGTRMGNSIPKQFLHLCGQPILMHTIEAFFNYDKFMNIIVVLPQDQQEYWNELCEKHDFQIKHQIVAGGKTRFHSVQNGLCLVDNDAVVGIHDGVRPLISKTTIEECYDEGRVKGAVFPAIPVTDTLRKKTEAGTELVDRNNYCLVQTPQVFHSNLIKKAYEQEYSEQFTDDVSVIETLGEYRVSEVKGDRQNIKITTPGDLIIAEAILNSIDL